MFHKQGQSYVHQNRGRGGGNWESMFTAPFVDLSISHPLEQWLPLAVAGFSFDPLLISFFLNQQNNNSIPMKLARQERHRTQQKWRNTANAKLEEMKNVNADFAVPKLD